MTPYGPPFAEPPLRPRWVERIELVARDRRGLAAGAQIVRLDIRVWRVEFDAAPLSPAALVAAQGVLIGEAAAEFFQTASQPRRKHAGRSAGWADGPRELLRHSLGDTRSSELGRKRHSKTP